MFAELIDSDLKIIIDAVEEVAEIQPETAIITEGDAGDCLYIIESGKFYAKKNIYETQDDSTKKLLEQKIVKECGSGDAFGELALLYSTPRAASVVAASFWAYKRIAAPSPLRPHRRGTDGQREAQLTLLYGCASSSQLR